MNRKETKKIISIARKIKITQNEFDKFLECLNYEPNGALAVIDDIYDTIILDIEFKDSKKENDIWELYMNYVHYGNSDDLDKILNELEELKIK